MGLFNSRSGAWNTLNGEAAAPTRRSVQRSFERDPIDWHTPGAKAMRAFYTRLCQVYRSHGSLRHGRMRRLKSTAPIYAFWREARGETLVLVVANLSGESAAWQFPRKPLTDLMTGATVRGELTEIPPWSTFLLA